MEITVHTPDTSLPCIRGHVITMTINSFKGRRDVEVHLFRSKFEDDEMEAYDWDLLLGPTNPAAPGDENSSKRMLLETFTEEERDAILEFLAEQYKTRLSAITAQPIDFPVPRGLPAFSDMSEGKDIGFVRFEKIPSYDLKIPMTGLYDLSRHEPVVSG